MNKLIWVPDKEYEWILAEIVEVKGDLIRASLTSSSRSVAITGNISSFASMPSPQPNSFIQGFNMDFSANINAIFDMIPSQQITLKKKQSFRFDYSHIKDLNDLCEMKYLHDGPILHVLRRRWLAGQIYTNIGDVLLSMNPYKGISGLYDDPIRYFQATDKSNLKPHVYSLADDAYKSMCGSPYDYILGYTPLQQNQSIILSGESGSGASFSHDLLLFVLILLYVGKTEASKYIVNFLIQVNDYIKAGGQYIKDVVVDSTIVLEAFGNAKTTQNDNSTRFGKYIKLQYTEDNELVSTSIQVFLLERSRLIFLAKDERNFHIFYQLLRGIDFIATGIRAELKLDTPEDYRILIDGGTTTIKSSSDINDFSKVYDALLDIGCTEDDLRNLWAILGVILHLGNLTFHSSSDSESHEGPLQVLPSNVSLTHISKLLGVSEDDLKRALTTHVVNVRGGGHVKLKYLSIQDSIKNLHGLMKLLYQSIFSWLLQTMNKYHDLVLADDMREAVKYLGILDVFGFEMHSSNSLEQLCINYASERLQQQFNEMVFDREQEVYVREKITWNPIYYQDNQSIIDMISKKPSGLFTLLEEHNLMNRHVDDMALLSQYHQQHGNHPDRIYIKPRFGNDPSFMIRHYAASVSYQVTGFIEKNHDSILDDITDLMQKSSNQFLLRIIAANGMDSQETIAEDVPSPHSNKKRTALAASVTVTSSLRHQLDSLISALNQTENRYIKCLKPNEMKSSTLFQSSHLMKQLRYSDMIEVIRIRRARYRYVMRYSDLYKRYEILLRLTIKDRAPAKLAKEAEAMRYTKILVDQYLTSEHYQYGSSMLFLREIGYQILEDILMRYCGFYATIIQTSMRRFLAYRVYHKHLITERLRQADRARIMAEEIDDEQKALAKKMLEEQHVFESAKSFLSQSSGDGSEMTSPEKEAILRKKLSESKMLDTLEKDSFSIAKRERELATKIQKRETIRHHHRLYNSQDDTTSTGEADTSGPITDDDPEESKQMQEISSSILQSKEPLREEALRRRSPARLEEERRIRIEVELRRQDDVKRRAEKKRDAFEEEIVRRRIAEEAMRMQAVHKVEKYRKQEPRASETAASSPSSANAQVVGSSSSSAQSPAAPVVDKSESRRIDDIKKAKFEEQRRRAASTSRAEKKQGSWSLLGQTMDDVTIGFAPANDWTQPVGVWLSGLWPAPPTQAT
jgi:myosin heavy subunit